MRRSRCRAETEPARLRPPGRESALCPLSIVVVLAGSLAASGGALAEDAPEIVPVAMPGNEARDERAQAAVLPPSGEAVLEMESAAIADRLRRDKVLVMQRVREAGGRSDSLITALVIFERPHDEVYRLLSQTARQIEFRPSVTQMLTVEERAHGPLDEHRLKILFRTYVYRLEYRLEPAKHRMSWTLDSQFDNDLERVDGWWEFFALQDGRTLGRSGTIVDVGPAVPGFLQDWITRKNLPKTMRHVQRWVDSSGAYRP